MPWSPESRARAAERMRKLHADPEFKAKSSERAAERMRKLNADPEFKAATAERMRKLHADPEFKAATAERMRKLHADPEFKAATAERMRKLHADPEFKARNAPLANLSPDGRNLYNKMRACGVTRDEALAEIARATSSTNRARNERRSDRGLPSGRAA